MHNLSSSPPQHQHTAGWRRKPQRHARTRRSDYGLRSPPATTPLPLRATVWCRPCRPRARAPWPCQSKSSNRNDESGRRWWCLLLLIPPPCPSKKKSGHSRQRTPSGCPSPHPLMPCPWWGGSYGPTRRCYSLRTTSRTRVWTSRRRRGCCGWRRGMGEEKVGVCSRGRRGSGSGSDMGMRGRIDGYAPVSLVYVCRYPRHWVLW